MTARRGLGRCGSPCGVLGANTTIAAARGSAKSTQRLWPAHAPAAAPAWPGEPGPTMSADADLDSRGRLLRAAVGFALVPPSEPELQLRHRWLDCWRGVGDVVRGMATAWLVFEI